MLVCCKSSWLSVYPSDTKKGLLKLFSTIFKYIYAILTVPHVCTPTFPAAFALNNSNHLVYTCCCAMLFVALVLHVSACVQYMSETQTSHPFLQKYRSLLIVSTLCRWLSNGCGFKESSH